MGPEEILPRKNQQPNSAIAVSSLMIFSFKTDLSVFHCQQPTMPTPYNYYINKMIIISTYIHTDPYDPLTKKELKRQNKQTKQIPQSTIVCSILVASTILYYILSVETCQINVTFV